jgi:hypothetical protein
VNDHAMRSRRSGNTPPCVQLYITDKFDTMGRGRYLKVHDVRTDSPRRVDRVYASLLAFSPFCPGPGFKYLGVQFHRHSK